MGKLVDLTGERFGRLIVSKRTEHQRNRVSWECVCDCGNTKIVSGSNLSSGTTNSCGCIKKELLYRRNRKDLSTHNLSNSPLYVVWDGIKKRSSLNRKHNKHMIRYRDRGIVLCDEWDNSFELFYKWASSNGYKHGLQIDRINNNGNYEPSNCRFVAAEINSLNRVDTIPINKIEKGIIMYKDGHTIAHISRVLDCKYSGLYQALTGRRGKSRIEKVTRNIQTNTMEKF